MPEKKKSEKKKEGIEGLFIPAILFIGMGLGLIYNNLAAGTLIGLGIGFIIMALIRLLKK